MEIYLISNNLFENNLTYLERNDIELKKMTRPLSLEGEDLAKRLSTSEYLDKADLIYSSMYASSLDAAKFLAERLDEKIIIDENLNDCKIGDLGSRSLKNVKFMQEHDFDIKLSGGESLNEVGERMQRVINKCMMMHANKIVIFTHKRSILGYLLKIADYGYNLDDELIVEYNDNVVFNNSSSDYDLIKLRIVNRTLKDIQLIN